MGALKKICVHDMPNMSAISDGETENNATRFFVRRCLGPQPLTCLAQNVLVDNLDRVRRLDSTAARQWAQRHVPQLVRESLLHHVTSLGNDNTIVKFWSMLYSHQMRSVCIPADLDDRARSTLVQYLGAGLDNSIVLPTLVLRVICAHTPRESEALHKNIARAPFLTVFIHRKGADNHALKILGSHCPSLQEINVTGSPRVTDQGIAFLFGIYTGLKAGFDYSAIQPQDLTECSKSLRFMKMRSSGVRVQGVRCLLHCARALQGVRCSSYDVLQALAAQLKTLSNFCDNYDDKRRVLPLRYLDFSNCFAILSKYMWLLPDLIEVRVGSDAPPLMRQTTKRLLVDDSDQVDDANMLAALSDLPKLVSLRTLVLKAFALKCLVPLLNTQIGFRLRRLDLHYTNVNPGINLIDIGIACPFLTDLAVCDSLVTWSSDGVVTNNNNNNKVKRKHKRKQQQFSSEPNDRCGKTIFTRLESLKLLRVTYRNVDDWEHMPRLANNIRILHMESSRGMTDAAMQSILIDNQFSQLEEFLVSGSSNRLTARTVVRLTSVCLQLRWLGDLRDWNISARERNVSLPKLLDSEWQRRKSEPKVANDEFISAANNDETSLSVSDSYDILTKLDRVVI